MANAKLADMERMLNQIVDAWESLAGGKQYSVRVFADWMNADMKPAMDRARRLLGRQIPGEGDDE
ncbi:MAG: hypothetical protein EHM41_00160 [Chloroflexi bacterium]|nr:MAG: hypothetical protein EHM41_00160 [Chloroflexota bacterium]